MYEWTPQPASPLHGIVERIWHWDGSPADPRERVFPDVTLELIVQLDRAYRAVVDGTTGDPFPFVCIEGLRSGAATIEAPAGRCRVMGLRFTPPAVCALLRRPLGDIVGRTIDLRDALGQPARELAELCGDAADAPEPYRSRRSVGIGANAFRRTGPLVALVHGDHRGERGPSAHRSAGGCNRFVVCSPGAPVPHARRFDAQALRAAGAFPPVARSPYSRRFDCGYRPRRRLLRSFAFRRRFRRTRRAVATAFVRAAKFPQGTSLSEAAPR